MKQESIQIPPTALIIDIVRNILSLEDNYSLDPNTKLESLPGYDSIAFINIVDTLEEHFSTKFNIESLAEVTSIAGLIDIVSLSNLGDG